MTVTPGGAKPLLPGATAAVASGVALAVAFPGLDIGPLALIALVPLFWSWRDATPARCALFGLLAGVAFFSIHLWWVVYFGAVAIVPFIAALSIYWAATGYVIGFLHRLNVRSPLIVAATWVCFEAVRTSWPLGGFPWGQPGVALHDFPVARAVAEWGGIPLVTFIVVLFNALLVEAIIGWQSRSQNNQGFKVTVVSLVGVIAFVGLADLFRFTATPTGSLRIAMLQGNDLNRPLTQKEVDSDYLTRRHLELAAELRGKYDLIVFPESGLMSDPESDQRLMLRLRKIAREHDSFLMVNVVDEQARGKRYNANRLYSPSGLLVGTYAKQHLVPFGEYVPWRESLKFISALQQVSRDLDPGEKAVVFDLNGTPIGTVICFESAFGPLVRESVRKGAQAIVVTTNNRSFRRSANSVQHLALSQMNAAAVARPMLQSSISGTTAVISASGDVSHATRLFENQVVSARITTTIGDTPYVRYGAWVVWSCLACVFTALILGLNRRRVSA